MNKNFKQLKEAIDKQGQNLFREINTIIEKMKADVEYMDSKRLDDLEKRGKTCRISEIEQDIADKKEIVRFV